MPATKPRAKADGALTVHDVGEHPAATLTKREGDMSLILAGEYVNESTRRGKPVTLPEAMHPTLIILASVARLGWRIHKNVPYCTRCGKELAAEREANAASDAIQDAELQARADRMWQLGQDAKAERDREAANNA